MTVGASAVLDVGPAGDGPAHIGPRGPWLVAALLAMALYAVTLWGSFVYDDRAVIRDDPRVTEPGRWVEYFKEPYLPGAPDPLWRPLPCLTYALQWRIHGGIAWPFHLINILLHAFASALVAELAWRWTARIWAAYIAGAIFAAH